MKLPSEKVRAMKSLPLLKKQLLHEMQHNVDSCLTRSHFCPDKNGLNCALLRLSYIHTVFHRHVQNDPPFFERTPPFSKWSPLWATVNRVHYCNREGNRFRLAKCKWIPTSFKFKSMQPYPRIYFDANNTQLPDILNGPIDVLKAK